MSIPTTIDPVRTEVVVRVDPERAWEVFTRDPGRWWPVESHSVAAGDDHVPERLVLEPREDGEFYELYGGIKRHWARIHTWEPPRRLGYTWRVNPDNPPTEVEITFTPVDGGTRVEVVHSGWEAYADGGAAARASYGDEGGWRLVLAAFDHVVRGVD
ncbi:MAG TPA: SRPBCC domain-containing protein [Gaiellaceae bacterium]|jgi:uncharacterized protein YndB with AHSA1/START domain|nr:SRPBCC domain-containing protein [Gaiellaceae bacterium]